MLNRIYIAGRCGHLFTYTAKLSRPLFDCKCLREELEGMGQLSAEVELIRKWMGELADG